MTEIFEGPVRVFTANKDGQPYVIKNGKRAGQHYCRVSFDHNGETLYLADFSNDAAEWDGLVCKVAYSVKVDDFNEPILYNGNKQWNLDAIKPLEATNTARGGANPATPAAQSGVSAQSPDERQNSIQRQTAAKCASDVMKADTSHSATFDVWDQWFDHILARIENKPDVMQEAKDKLDAVEEDDSDDVPF